MPDSVRAIIMVAVCIGLFVFGALTIQARTDFATVVALIALAALAVLHVLFRPDELAAERKAKGLCQRCGYDLRGNVSGVCPECGQDYR